MQVCTRKHILFHCVLWSGIWLGLDWIDLIMMGTVLISLISYTNNIALFTKIKKIIIIERDCHPETAQKTN